MARRYLITGGSGFVGTALVKRLVGEGHSVRVLDNDFRGNQARLAALASEIEFVPADIRDAEAVISAAGGVDSVIHLAHINSTKYFYFEPQLVLDVGVRGMLNVIDACRRQGVGELVLASSSEVYQSPPVVPTDESAPLTVPDVLNARYSYAGSKIISELLAINYGRRDFERVLIFRPHNVYGPDMGWDHVLPQFVLRALDEIDRTPQGPVPFPIQGDGTQTRAFIHIDDFTDGLMCVLRRGQHLNVYHIGNPEELTIATVARRVLENLGREARLIPGPGARGGTTRRCPDVSKLKTLGFEPHISFDEGLPMLVDWYVRNRHLRPRSVGLNRGESGYGHAAV